ncbi:MAG: hypothetical protein MRY64_17090, partial [Hyphomonadaceae bacterium]|nr:hypothetical protein [Hyphomonadaceae bacterium]
MAEEAHKEPTMEEILASIRKIISEDDEPRSQIAPESQAQMRTVDPEPVVEAASAPDMALEEDDSMFEEFDLSDITETASEAPAPETPQPSPLDIAEEDEAESAAGDVFEDVELPVIEDEAPGMAVEEEVFDLP